MAIHPHPRDPAIVCLAQNSGNLSRLDMRPGRGPSCSPIREMAAEARPARVPVGLVAAFHRLVARSERAVCRRQLCVPLSDWRGAAQRRGRSQLHCRHSPDLSAQQDKPVPPVGEGHHSYGALFSLAQSPADPAVLWAGADDGRFTCRATRARPGRVWTARFRQAPTRTVSVSKIRPSRNERRHGLRRLRSALQRRPQTVSAFKTTDFGKTWTTITNDLPAWGTTYVIREDPHNERCCTCGDRIPACSCRSAVDPLGAVEGDAAAHCAVRSLVVHPRDRELVVGTFGRSIWIGDVSVIEQLRGGPGQSTFLYEVKPAVAHNIRYRYGTAGRGNQRRHVLQGAESATDGTMISLPAARAGRERRQR